MDKTIFNLLDLLKKSFKNKEINIEDIKHLYFMSENVQLLKNDFNLFFLLEYLNDYEKKQLKNTKYITLSTTENHNRYIDNIFNFYPVSLLNLSEYFIFDENTENIEYFKEKEKIFINIIKELYFYFLKVKNSEHIIQTLDYFNINVNINFENLLEEIKDIEVEKSFGKIKYKYLYIVDIIKNSDAEFNLKNKYQDSSSVANTNISIEEFESKLKNTFDEFKETIINAISADKLNIDNYVNIIQNKNINIYITSDINDADTYNLIDFQNLINFVSLKNYFKIFLKNLNLLTDVDTLKYYFNIFGTNDIINKKYYIREIESNYIHNEIFKLFDGLKYIKNLYVRVPLFFLSDLENYIFFIENMKTFNKNQIFIRFSDIEIKDPSIINYLKNKYLITSYETVKKLISKNKLLYKNFEYTVLLKDLTNMDNFTNNFYYINIESIILYRKFLNLKNCYLFIQNIDVYKKIDDIRKEFANFIEEKIKNINNIEDFIKMANKIEKCYQMSINDLRVIESILLSRAFEELEKF